MADSFPISARTGVAREPLDPTAVTPGPQPLDVSERTETNLIVGEVLKPGRHRAHRPRRKVAISGAVLSAAGAFVTLALMLSHGNGGTVSAAPRVAPSAPLPDLPDEPAASQHPEHTGPTAKPPVHTAVPVVEHAPAAPHTAAPPPAPARTQPTAQQRWATQAAQFRAQMRKEATHDAQAWAAAMRQAAQQQQAAQRHGTGYGYEQRSSEQNSAMAAAPQSERGREHGRHARGPGHDGRYRGHGGR